MNARELELWVCRLVGDATAGRPIEDGRVELKATWPEDSFRAARRIAGHLNAAGAAEGLWVVGIDEKARQVCGASQVDLASWWLQVVSHFDELPPSLIHSLNIQIGGVVVTALLFDAERAPYVLKAPQSAQPIEREIPWREGTRVRSARRSDVFRLMSSTVLLPSLEIDWCNVDLIHEEGETKWYFEGTLYVLPATASASFSILARRSAFEIRDDSRAFSATLHDIAFSDRQQVPNSAILSTQREAHVNGPGALKVYARGRAIEGERPSTAIAVTARLHVLHAPREAVTTFFVSHAPSEPPERMRFALNAG